MSYEKNNETEFAVGIILACVGSLLLYTQYHSGYWGVLALGIIFIIKNLPRTGKKRETGVLEKREKDRDFPRGRLNR